MGISCVYPSFLLRFFIKRKGISSIYPQISRFVLNCGFACGNLFARVMAKMKFYKFLSLMISVVIISLLFASCGADMNSGRLGDLSDSTSQSEKLIDNTAASEDHERIYYYNDKNNVAYDASGCYDYCFMTPYLAPHPTGGAILVFPGGGYNHLSNDSNRKGSNNDGDQKEASAIVPWFNSVGISVFVVNYRTTCVEKSLDYHQLMSDGTRAMRYIRHNADKYYIDKNKIGILGYSAGGHLAAMLLTKYYWQVDDGDYIKDAIDGESAKADAGLLSYAVLSFANGSTHAGTRDVFTGGNAELYDIYSPDKLVNENTSPCFCWCEEGDQTVPSSSTYDFSIALETAGVECECHVFNDTEGVLHGIGVAQKFDEASVWPTLATEFLKRRGF